MQVRPAPSASVTRTKQNAEMLTCGGQSVLKCAVFGKFLPENRSADLYKAVAGGEYQGLEPGVHTQLVQYVHHVGALGIYAHVQCGRYLLVREALGELLQDLLLAGRDLLDARARFYLFFAVLSGQAEQLDQLVLGEQGLAFAETSRGIEYRVDIGRLVQDAGRPCLDRPGVLRPIQARGQD